ncbi:MAG: hypothetical protein IKV94_02785 [Clostridia bacterium]|nr:hypothetical protein [Clostridia bacterium]MBR6517132.1 hypothetical protein [Bacilli bacterium]
MTKKEREIIKQDIIDLGYLEEMYSKQKQFQKASECLKERQQLESKLKGGKL